MAELIFYRGEQEVVRYPLLKSFKLGRHPENDLTLPDRNISRFHCVIVPHDGSFSLTDRSRNGTYLNGERIKSVRLKDDDKIRIGPWQIRFVDQQPHRPERETITERKQGNLPVNFFGMVGKSAAIRSVFALIEKLAPMPTPLLVIGETGTGKELVARALHELSGHAGKPFVAVNCGAISPQLIESELFGHEKGAFTGATERHIGAFEQAENGTLFLDEIGELPLELQPKLLRVLEDQRFRRVGGKGEVVSKARLIAATHRNLPAWVEEGKFREDLFFRLFTIPIQLPALRDRAEDIPALVDYFLAQFRPDGGKRFNEQALAKLQTHSWKGNIRELKNTVMRALLLSLQDEIGERDLHLTTVGAKPDSLDSREKEAIIEALRRNNWNKTRAAATLQIAKSTLFQKIKEYGIQKT